VRIAVTGSTGLIGSRLVHVLRSDGHEVIRVVRPGSRSADGPTVEGDPPAGRIDAAGLEGVDAVIHLAGEGIAEKRWSTEQKRRILDSRRQGTTVLAEALAGLDRKPAVLLSGSAIGWYGDRGDEVLTETSAPGSGFLTEVCLAWEAAAAPAADVGIRTAFLRTGLVLDRSGGALAKLVPLFKLGVGGRLGSGRQWWSWISLDDWIGAARFLLDRSDMAGPVNLTGPAPVTNAEFTRALASVLRRPALLPVPAFGPALLLGRELAHDLLFASQRVEPAVLEAAGYEFRHPDVTSALRAVLQR
jgi:uncharacterized protein (TIGR01777 family)